MTRPHINPFVGHLIQLQQDGKAAISGPANWLVRPLIQVSTPEADRALEELIREITPGEDPQSGGRWHWLIGSPGNGKSAKVGELARRLHESGFEIVDENETSIFSGSLTGNPYLLEVREPDKRYACAMLVQDASVVRKPFDDDCDPVQDLIDILRVACDKGRSLLICTNWGVLHRLYDLARTHDALKEEAWYRAVKWLVNPTREDVTVTAGGKKPVFPSVKVTFEWLDHHSLLIGSDLFERLIDAATEDSHWRACEQCPSRYLCPLKANRDNLFSQAIRERVVNVLRRAEVLDGQIIVFREAVALVSLFLAGCPNDHGGKSPCEWVHDRVQSGDIFHLLARRLPMIFFGSSSQCGLETGKRISAPNKNIQRDQKLALTSIMELFDDNCAARRALEGIFRDKNLSSEVGVARLLGPFGSVTRLDPTLDPRNAEMVSKFIADAGGALEFDGISEIERFCIKLWQEMIDKVEAEGVAAAGTELYFWLRRWQTTCLGWQAGVSLGLTAFQAGLEEYLAIFQSANAERRERREVIRRTEKNLNDILAQRSAQDVGETRVELASSMFLAGRWAELELRPKVDEEASRPGNLCVTLGENKYKLAVSAETFVSLKRRHEVGLSDVSFNPDMLDALKRARAQAAATSQYSVKNDDVRIIILDHEEREHVFERSRGDLL